MTHAGQLSRAVRQFVANRGRHTRRVRQPLLAEAITMSVAARTCAVAHPMNRHPDRNQGTPLSCVQVTDPLYCRTAAGQDYSHNQKYSPPYKWCVPARVAAVPEHRTE